MILTFILLLFSCSQTLVSADTNLLIGLSERLSLRFEQQQDGDVEINYKNKKFKCCKFILCTQSEYFKSLYSSDLKEYKLGIININKISSNMGGFISVRNFEYFLQICHGKNPKKIFELLGIKQHYELVILFDYFLCTSLNLAAQRFNYILMDKLLKKSSELSDEEFWCVAQIAYRNNITDCMARISRKRLSKIDYEFAEKFKQKINVYFKLKKEIRNKNWDAQKIHDLGVLLKNYNLELNKKTKSIMFSKIVKNYIKHKDNYADLKLVLSSNILPVNIKFNIKGGCIDGTFGSPLLSYAAQEGAANCFVALFELGADPRERSVYAENDSGHGQTCIYWAKDSSMKKFIIKILKKRQKELKIIEQADKEK